MDQSPTPGVAPATPRFCPRCQLVGEPNRSLCAVCGETLRGQGYCPICEAFWKLDAGRDCPKHDVELIDEAPPADPFATAEAMGPLVTVATYAHPTMATAPRIRLEAEGIPTFLDGEHVAGNSFSQVATGGVRLQVPASLASAARVLIAQTWSPPVDPDDDLDDAFDELAPEPGRRRRAIMKVAIWVMLLGPTALYIASMIAAVVRDGLR